MTKVVAEAREWLGTPYLHQASAKGAGCDCLGLVRGVWRNVLGSEPEAPPAYTQDWDEVGGQELLSGAAGRHLVRLGALAPGAVLLFRMRPGAVAKHLGICSSDGPVPRFIHAYSRHGVVETTLSDPWRRRVVGIFAFPLTD